MDSKFRHRLRFGVGGFLAVTLMGGCAQNAAPSASSNPFAQPTPNFGNPWNAPPSITTPALPPGTPGMPPPANAPPYATNGGVPPASPATTGRAARPNWSQPGTVTQQRSRAIRFDPFADNQAGPEIVGGRPLSYIKQQPETVKATEFNNPALPF